MKVLDFGLVKSGDTSGDGLTQLTLQGVTTGTPAYMAPEMAVADQEMDFRVDLYALGCVAYWLLTGQLVFDAKSHVEMLIHHAQSEPVPPSQRTEFEVPPALDELILCCLEKNPANRPATAEELSRRLEACPLGESWTQEHARNWWQLHLPE